MVVGMAAVMGSAATPARACSIPEGESNQHFDHRAAPGGTWWAQFYDDGGTGIVHLTGLDGAADIDVAIVSAGPGNMVALAVPDDAVVGARYGNEALQISAQWSEEALEVVADDDSPQIVDEAMPVPGLRVDVREVRQGYRDVLVAPLDGECSHATGWWDFTYGEGAFALIDAVPAGFLLDMTVRYPGEDGFAPVTMANEILFDAAAVAAVDEYVSGLPDDGGVFTVNARFRRIADGAVGEVVSVDVALDLAQTQRTEFVGCGCSSNDAPIMFGSLFALGLLSIRRRRTARL